MLKHSPRERDPPKHQGQSHVVHLPLPLRAAVVQETGCPVLPPDSSLSTQPRDRIQGNWPGSQPAYPRDTTRDPVLGPSRASYKPGLQEATPRLQETTPRREGAWLRTPAEVRQEKFRWLTLLYMILSNTHKNRGQSGQDTSADTEGVAHSLTHLTRARVCQSSWPAHGTMP